MKQALNKTSKLQTHIPNTIFLDRDWDSGEDPLYALDAEGVTEQKKIELLIQDLFHGSSNQ